MYLRAFIFVLILSVDFGSRAAAQDGGFLGIEIRELTSEEAAALGWQAPRGIKVIGVTPDGPAYRAGVKEGDIILSIDGVDMTGSIKTKVETTVETATETTVKTTLTVEFAVVAFLRTKRAGDSADLLMVRDRVEVRLKAALAPAPPRPVPVLPTTLPACKGRDLFPELKEKDPAGHARVAAKGAATLNSGAVLWRIDRPGRASSYLFGTAHVTDDRVHALSPAIKAAFAGAKRLALEVDPFSPRTKRQAQSGEEKLPPGQSLKSELPVADYELLVAILKRRHTPQELFDGLKPRWAVARLSTPQCEEYRQLMGATRLDDRFAQEAKARGVPVVGLEAIEDQWRRWDGLPKETQIAILRLSILLHDRSEDFLETYVQRYLARDIGTIAPLSDLLEEGTGVSLPPPTPYEQELSKRRNQQMRDAALPHLEEGGLFIAVGAAHLIGTNGLVELFRQAGYSVTAVE